MKSLDRPLQELIDIALTTTKEDIIEYLVHSPYMNVRRALARNRNISTHIINILAMDPVVNVSYMAIKSNRSNINKEFNNVHPCVSCNLDERHLNCSQCSILNKFYIVQQ